MLSIEWYRGTNNQMVITVLHLPGVLHHIGRLAEDGEVVDEPDQRPAVQPSGKTADL